MKTALPHQMAHIREIMQQIRCLQMMQAEFLQTRRINQAGFAVQIIKAGMSGGVFARIERGRDFAHPRHFAAQQRIGQRRFSHSRLAEKNIGFALQNRSQRRNIVQRTHFHQRIAQRLIKRQFLAPLCRLRQIRLVQYNNRADIRCLRRQQRPLQQQFVRRRHRRQHD